MLRNNRCICGHYDKDHHEENVASLEDPIYEYFCDKCDRCMGFESECELSDEEFSHS